jgi:2,4-dihydroxyhept-2-ene-1,7-dioic acid aldolase
LDTPGISGIYIGPSDLGLSLGLKPLLDREEPQIFSIYDMLLKTTGNAACCRVHNLTGAYAARMIDKGFRFVTLGNDSGLMARAARNEIAIARKNAGAIAS